VKVASYNVHKFRGTDGIVSPARVIDVICELNADLVALQEIDCRFGQRGHRLEPETIEKKTGMRFLGQSDFPDRHGWHGNALLARGELKTYRRARLRLPGLEPRGAIVRWRAGRCRQGYCDRSQGVRCDDGAHRSEKREGDRPAGPCGLKLSLDTDRIVSKASPIAPPASKSRLREVANAASAVTARNVRRFLAAQRLEDSRQVLEGGAIRVTNCYGCN
jgi:hypothetical protein